MKKSSYIIPIVCILCLFLTGCGANVGENKLEINQNSENNEIKEVTSCEENYNTLFKKYERNYTDCYFNKPNISSCEGGNPKKGKINLSIIFDASGSMGAKIGDETMMEIAKDKIKDYISNIDNNTDLSFVLYGHKGNSSEKGKVESCKGIETIYSFSDKNIVSLKNKISNFIPNGYTPIATSLIQAKKLIKEKTKENDKNIILLISDGIETCGGDPVKEALDISKINNTFVDVIGFNVEGETQKQLMDIAKEGKGNYYDVKNRLDFEQTFNKTKNFLDTMSCGVSKASIELNYGAEAINKYFNCMYRLKEEQIFMMADANDECKSYFQDKLEPRFDSYEGQFEIILRKGEEILNTFSDNIKEIEEEF